MELRSPAKGRATAEEARVSQHQNIGSPEAFGVNSTLRHSPRSRQPHRCSPSNAVAAERSADSRRGASFNRTRKGHCGGSGDPSRD